MISHNYVSIIGTICKEPVSKKLPSGTEIQEFTIYAEDPYTTKAGTTIKNSLYIDCSIMGMGLLKLQQPLREGAEVLITGSLRFSSWESDGVKRYKHTILCNSCSFLGSSQQVDNGTVELPEDLPF